MLKIKEMTQAGIDREIPKRKVIENIQKDEKNYTEG